MTHLLTQFAAACNGGHFLNFPTWYKYVADPDNCSVVKITSINDVWLIVAAIVEIMIRIAGILAVVFVMYAGYQYITSEAEPDKVNKAKNTLINALIGLAITILATALINFIAGSFI